MHLDAQISSLPFRNRWKQVHPAEKTLLFGGCVLLALTSPVGGLTALSLATAAAIAGAGIPVSAWWRFLRAPLGFTVLSLATLSMDWRNGAFAFTPDATLWTQVLCRALGTAAAAGFLALTTPLDQVFHVLAKLGVPAVFVSLLAAIYRFTFTTILSLGRMLASFNRRNPQPGWRPTIAAAGLLMSSLLMRSLRQAARKEEAIEWRTSVALCDPVLLPQTWQSARPAVLLSLASFFLVVWTWLVVR